MKTEESVFFIDKFVEKYQSLSKKEKAIINLGIGIFFIISVIERLYISGEILGKFLYNIIN